MDALEHEDRSVEGDDGDRRRRRARPALAETAADRDPEMARRIDAIAQPLLARRGALLPLLHAVQAEMGHIPDTAVPHIAAALNLSRAEVHGVITFYHDFRRAPAGAHVLKLCRAEACQARGGAAIEAAAVARFGVAMGETRGDGRVTLEPIYCLGLCATGPNALVDGRPVSRIDAAALERIAAEVLA